MADLKLHANNISTTLAGDITNVATSITVADATGMPSPTGSQYFAITITDGTNTEILHCSSRSGTTLTVSRGEEGTSGTAFLTGDIVELRPTADDIDRKQQDLDGLSVTSATVATGDKVLIQDVDDSDNLKYVTAQSVADLGLQASADETITGNWDFTGGEIKLPIDTTVAAAEGQFGIDNTVTGFTDGLISYYLGGDFYRIPAVEFSQLNSISNGDYMAYSSSSQRFEIQTPAWLENVVEDTSPTLGGNLAGGGYNISGVGDLTLNGGSYYRNGTNVTPTKGTFLHSNTQPWLNVANNLTDANQKTGGLVVPHYTNSEEPASAIQVATQSAANIVSIGGGNSNVNAATEVRVYGAANNTTTTGSEVVRFDPSGLSFDAGTNYLDDYEEGTFTPTVTFGTPGDLSVSYSSQLGDYIKIGNLVVVKVNVTCTPTFTTASGELRVASLPYSAYRSWGGVLQNQQGLSWGGYSLPVPVIGNSATYVVMVGLSSGSSGAPTLQETEVTSGATLQIAFNLYYWES